MAGCALTTLYNAVITVGSLVSVAIVAGADTYNGSDLNIAVVQAGASTFNNVTVI